MIRSMTAFASRSGTLGPLDWVWDMRGVNARGLDIRVRMPDGLETVDVALRKALKSRLARGNVSIGLRLNRDDTAQPLALDTVQLDRVLQALEAVQERAMEQGLTLAQPTAADVLNQRGVILSGSGDQDDAALSTALIADIDPLIDDFVAMRGQEGTVLNDILTGQLDQIATLTAQAGTQAEDRRPHVAEALRAAVARVSEDVEVDPARLAQELALIATKQDVTEEIDRLGAHVSAAREMLASGKPAGRKLDFLAQEFNREVNTLCSKSQNATLTATGLELKAIVDQFREQVQNVE